MTVAEVFEKAGLRPSGPVRWKESLPESHKGVYVIARVDKPNVGCAACELPLRDPLPPNLKIDPTFEHHRWLPDEPVIYIGKTDQMLKERVGQFYQQRCGNRSPHAGGQAILLLNCDLWVYWSPSLAPRHDERAMLDAFKKQTGAAPFANFNFDGKRRSKRLRLDHGRVE